MRDNCKNNQFRLLVLNSVQVELTHKAKNRHQVGLGEYYE